MIKKDSYKLIFKKFKNTDEIPRDDNMFYRCTNCQTTIPSVPEDNIGCLCENIFIDKDCWRLIVNNLEKFEILEKID